MLYILYIDNIQNVLSRLVLLPQSLFLFLELYIALGDCRGKTFPCEKPLLKTIV